MLAGSDSCTARESERKRCIGLVGQAEAGKVNGRTAGIVQLYSVGVFSVAVGKAGLVLRADLVYTNGRLGCADDFKALLRACRHS